MTPIQQITARFDELLREHMGDNYQVAVELNKTADGGVCFAHDFCDPNQLLIDAFHCVMGYEPEPVEDYNDSKLAADWDLMDQVYESWHKLTGYKTK